MSKPEAILRRLALKQAPFVPTIELPQVELDPQLGDDEWETLDSDEYEEFALEDLDFEELEDDSRAFMFLDDDEDEDDGLDGGIIETRLDDGEHLEFSLEDLELYEDDEDALFDESPNAPEDAQASFPVLPENWLMEPSTANIDCLVSALALCNQQDDWLRRQGARVLVRLCPPDPDLYDEIALIHGYPKLFIEELLRRIHEHHPEPAYAFSMDIVHAMLASWSEGQMKLAAASIARVLLAEGLYLTDPERSLQAQMAQEIRRQLGQYLQDAVFPQEESDLRMWILNNYSRIQRELLGEPPAEPLSTKAPPKAPDDAPADKDLRLEMITDHIDFAVIVPEGEPFAEEPVLDELEIEEASRESILEPVGIDREEEELPLAGFQQPTQELEDDEVILPPEDDFGGALDEDAFSADLDGDAFDASLGDDDGEQWDDMSLTRAGKVTSDASRLDDGLLDDKAAAGGIGGRGMDLMESEGLLESDKKEAPARKKSGKKKKKALERSRSAPRRRKAEEPELKRRDMAPPAPEPEPAPEPAPAPTPAAAPPPPPPAPRAAAAPSTSVPPGPPGGLRGGEQPDAAAGPPPAGPAGFIPSPPRTEGAAAPKPPASAAPVAPPAPTAPPPLPAEAPPPDTSAGALEPNMLDYARYEGDRLEPELQKAEPDVSLGASISKEQLSIDLDESDDALTRDQRAKLDVETEDRRQRIAQPVPKSDLGIEADVSEEIAFGGGGLLEQKPMPPASQPMPARPTPMQQQEQYPAAPKSAGVGWLGKILTLPLWLIAAPFIGLYWLGKKAWQGIHWLFDRGMSKLRAEAAERGIPVFELFLGDEATRPGPIERSLAQSRAVMRLLHATIGLRIVAILCAIDAVLEIFTEYAHKVLRTWQSLKAKGKKFLRQRNRTLHQSMAEDLMRGRLQLARLLGLAGYTPEKYYDLLQKDELQEVLGKETFTLEMVLELRGFLDELKRDLAGLPQLQLSLEGALDSISSSAKASLKQTLIGLIPNPFSFLASWKDLLVLAFCMKYSRSEIERMYIDLVDTYQFVLDLSLEAMAHKEAEKGLDLPPEEVEKQLMELWAFERKMLDRCGMPRHGLGVTDPEIDVKSATEAAQQCLQRWVQALAFPQRLLDLRKRQVTELLLEFHLNEQLHHPAPRMALETEQWIITQLQSLPSSMGNHQVQELEKQHKEAHLRRKRHKILRQIERAVGPWT